MAQLSEHVLVLTLLERRMPTKIRSRTTLLLGGLVVAALSSQSASAQVVFSDTIESYSLLAPTAFAATTAFPQAGSPWTTAVAGNAGIINNVASPNNSQVVSIPSNLAVVTPRFSRPFADIVPTASNQLEYSFDFYDSVGSTTASYRQYGEIRSSAPALEQLIAVGVSSTTTTGVLVAGGPAGGFSTLNGGTNYQARVAFGNAGNGWINLNAVRSIGWQNFKVLLDGSSIQIYVNGVLDSTVTAGAAIGAANGYDLAVIGSGLSSGGGNGVYDNVSVTVIPEPASLAVLASAGMLMLRRRSVR